MTTDVNLKQNGIATLRCLEEAHKESLFLFTGADSEGVRPSCAADGRNCTSLNLNTWMELGRFGKKARQPVSHNDNTTFPKGFCLQLAHLGTPFKREKKSFFFFLERLIYQCKQS